MNVEQENLRLKVNNIIDRYGIKANYICECTNINTAYFCRWRKGQKYLSIADTEALKKYIEQFISIF